MLNLSRFALMIAVVIALVVSPSTVSAEEEAPAKAEAKKSGQPTLDDLLDIDRPKSEPKDDKPAGEKPRIDADVKDELSGEEAVDAFKQAVREMAQAAELLQKQRDAGLPTQRIQRSVLAKLEQVIATAKKQQCQQCSSSSSSQKQAQKQDTGSNKNAGKKPQQANKPGGKKPGQQQAKAQGSKPNQGNVSPGSVDGVEEKGPLAELRAEWGNLPPRLRDELIQGLRERISPIYRKNTETYYRLLAEESKPE